MVVEQQTGNWNLADYDAARKDFSWQAAAKLLRLDTTHLNKAVACLDRHPPEIQQRVALRWHGAHGEQETYTFAEMVRLSNRFAKVLRAQGIQQGDRVFLFLERVPELYIALFGALKAGAVVGPLFSAFGPEAIRDRMADCGAKLLVTSPALKPRIDAIRAEVPTLQTEILLHRREPVTPGSLDWATLMADASDHFTPAPTTGEDYSVIHYTSGTTGKPKGAVHRHRAVIAQALSAHYCLDFKPETDVYWCTADPGWVTGTAYGMFGPWAWGVTQLVTEAGFSPAGWYSLIEQYKVTVWYTAPTAIRMLMKAGVETVRQHDLSSLRHLASVGEPLNPEAVYWGREAFGNTFHDTWWQTETGSMHIANVPCVPVKPGSMGKPLPGVTAAIVDDAWNPVPSGEEGHLVVKPDTPSFFATYWGREDLYQSRMKNGWYLTGDLAKQDEEGYFWFIGRSDDVINTAGHLVGPFEVESALLEHPAVAEAGVIGKPDEERLEIVKAFVALRAGFTPSEELKHEIQQFVRTRLAAHAYPRDISFVDSLPKTRSGKIMRRLLKARELGLPEGDTSTLEG
jgi:acetyl-CoA synthetase